MVELNYDLVYPIRKLELTYSNEEFLAINIPLLFLSGRSKDEIIITTVFNKACLKQAQYS